MCATAGKKVVCGLIARHGTVDNRKTGLAKLTFQDTYFSIPLNFNIFNLKSIRTTTINLITDGKTDYASGLR
jgi:hypothetical protein